jgi:tetratricopeptide (TPR) repeat protein
MKRQQTLQATVEWSHSLLIGAEQVLLRRLAVFAGRFDLDAAEAVCGFGDVQVPEIAGLLGSLVDKSLVVAEPALEAFRYRLLETIRLFAAEQLAEAGEGAAVAAGHCAHFLAVAEAAAPYLTGPEQGRWLARLDLDQANLRRAAQHAASHPDGTAVALRLGAALWRYWMARSRETEAFTLLAPTLRQSDARADPALFGAALFAAAMVGCFVDVQAARHFAEQAVQVARPLGDERLLISALAALGGAHFFAGDPEAGLPFGLEAVERARRLGDDVLLGMSLGIYAATLGAIDPARCPPLYAEAFACTRRSGDHLLDCDLHLNSAIAAVSGGDLPAARAHLDAAARAARQIGWEHVYITQTLGDVQRAEGDIDAARFTWQAALRASRRNGDNPAMASACHSLAVLAGNAGDWHQAAALHGAAQALIDRTGRPWNEDTARERRDSLRQARARLGDEQLERAYAQDVALSLDRALDPARGRADPA